MNIRPRILIILSAITALSAAPPENKTRPWKPGQYEISSQPDTLNPVRWIRTDSISFELLPPSTGIRFYRNGILFLSSSRFEEKMISDQLSFGKADARVATLNGDTLKNMHAFTTSGVFPYPCDGVTFSADFNSMYFTKYSRDAGVEKIYHARYEPGEGNTGNWIADKDPLSFCRDRSVYTHPALSADGKFMVFASDRPGSSGGLDLWVTTLKDGSWSEPENLGDAVNSTSNESFPFLDSDNNLYFSSDNVQGFGGYDIYVCKFRGNTWEKPINLSSPVNTMYDDIAFSVDFNSGKTAYYTIRHDKGKKALQLVRITFDKDRPDTLLTLSQFFTRPEISQMVILALEPAVQATDTEAENARILAGRKSGGRDTIDYRVQFMTSFNPRTRSAISLNGAVYNVTEFLYSGAYRLCIGDFATREKAKKLLNILKDNNYPGATIVEIKNNEFIPDEESGDNISEQKQDTDTVDTKSRLKQQETVRQNLNSSHSPENDPVKLTQKQDLIVYRVQISTNNVPKGNKKIQLDNKIYETYEYFYAGAYRLCLGEFQALAPAIDLLKLCRKSGYSQSFVVAFKNRVRSTDPALFK